MYFAQIRENEKALQLSVHSQGYLQRYIRCCDLQENINEMLAWIMKPNFLLIGTEDFCCKLMPNKQVNMGFQSFMVNNREKRVIDIANNFT